MGMPGPVAGEVRFYRAARVATAELDGWLPDHAVAVRDGAIEDVLPAAQAPDERTLDLGDAAILPGLVEGHAHLSCPPVPGAFDIVSAEPHERALIRAAESARRALRSGITTLLDLGGRNDVVFPLRDAIAAGETQGPRLLATGSPITRTNDHCWFWGGEVASPEAAVRKARDLVDAGADAIKVMAGGGNFTPTSNPRSRQFAPETLAEIVGAARGAGIGVHAHAHSASAVRAAVDAGVHRLVHCRWLADDPEQGYDYDPGYGRRIADEGIWVNPTIGMGLLAAEARQQGAEPPRRNPNMTRSAATREGILEIFQDMRAKGARFSGGLDMGMAYADFDKAAAEAWSFHEELGFSPWEAIRLITADTAECLGIAQEAGRIAKGLPADLAAYPGDPAQNLRTLSTPAFVLQAGEVRVSRSGIPIH